MTLRVGAYHASLSADLAAAGLFVVSLCTSSPTRAQQGETSPHKLELNMTFHENDFGIVWAKPPDCKTWPAAMRDFDAMRQAGENVITVKGMAAASSFVAHAYHGRVYPIEYTNLESIFIEPVGRDRFRVFTGNEPKGVVCGFDHAYYLDKLWLDAGLEGKLVPVPPRQHSPLDPLRSAYRWQSYTLVRPSLLQRGYSAFEIPETVAERCAPTTERLCQEFPEAVCNSELLDGITCTFVFRRDGTGQLVGIDASVKHLTAYTAHIFVTDVREVEAPTK